VQLNLNSTEAVFLVTSSRHPREDVAITSHEEIGRVGRVGRGFSRGIWALLHATRCNYCRHSNMLECLQLLQRVACDNCTWNHIISSIL